MQFYIFNIPCDAHETHMRHIPKQDTHIITDIHCFCYPVVDVVMNIHDSFFPRVYHSAVLVFMQLVGQYWMVLYIHG